MKEQATDWKKYFCSKILDGPSIFSRIHKKLLQLNCKKINKNKCTFQK